MRKILLIVLFISSQQFFAQELNCKVQVNYKNIGGTNTHVFQTLEKSLTDFVNKTVWTNRNVAPNERVECSMIITLKKVDGDRFESTIQVQSSRPVFNSSYETPIFTYKDNNFDFSYVEYDAIEFDKSEFGSNLVSTLAFYAYTILGLDADTFSLDGGKTYFEQAQAIANLAQAQGVRGWELDELKSKYNLIDELTSDTYDTFHKVLYDYHRLSLDTMATDAKKGKESLKKALMQLKSIYDIRSNSLVLKLFFDTKTTEIVDSFSGGPKVPNKDLKLLMIKLSPYNAVKFQKMRY
jgi:hypothetical protein